MFLRTRELLPRAEEAVGVWEKLERYSLDISHSAGRAKAMGFASILGITAEEIDYLAAEIHAGITERQSTTCATTPLLESRVSLSFRFVGSQSVAIASSTYGLPGNWRMLRLLHASRAHT
jgi:hypothetical protein